MKNKYMSMLALGIFAATAASAQTKIKDGTISSAVLPETNAILELESANKGLLLPRVTLDSTLLASPLSSHTAGMTVYNTASVNDVVPGYYYNDGAKWVRITQSEPWRIQHTVSDATTNVQNIYQEGRVAIGFSDADSVSDKQLEVKGHFKSNTDVGGRDVGMDTDLGGFGTYMYNLDDASDLTNASGNIIGVTPLSAGISTTALTNRSTISVYPGTVDLEAGGQGLTDNVARIQMGTSDFISNEPHVEISAAKGFPAASHNGRSSIMLRSAKGVEFRYYDTAASLDDIGKYTFPRTAGTVGQVLGVGTATSYGSTGGVDNQLEWKDVSALAPEPFQVASTTDKATTNTQNIYQNGNLGLGNFSASNPIAKLDVRGALRGGNPNLTATVGLNSVALGQNTKATNDNSFAIGLNSNASGWASFAIGANTTASSDQSVAMGTATTSSGNSSFATGQNATASGQASVAMGYYANASGQYSIALGGTASGRSSVAMGESQATGDVSTAMGVVSVASGVASTAMGTRTVASSFNETTMGTNNAIITGTANSAVATDALFQIGNGTNTTTLRNNALTILKNAHMAIGVDGTAADAKPTELLDLGGTATSGNGGLKIRNINSDAYTGDHTMNIVVADAEGVLMTAGVEGVKVPSGTTADRAATATFGTLRYNTTTGRGEMYVNDENGDGTQGDAGWRAL